MVYTSGIVTDITREETLEELQDNKLTIVCEKLDLQPHGTPFIPLPSPSFTNVTFLLCRPSPRHWLRLGHTHRVRGQELRVHGDGCYPLTQPS
jgi:hypothetical protein